jgi:hypothetical protein
MSHHLFLEHLLEARAKLLSHAIALWLS